MHARYSIRDGILDRSIGDELLVHRFDTDEVFVLNHDAKVIFEALKQSQSVADILQSVSTRVFGDACELNQAVITMLDQLVTEGIVMAEE